jgi:hypothetical protein
MKKEAYMSQGKYGLPKAMPLFPQAVPFVLFGARDLSSLLRRNTKFKKEK